MLLKLDINLFKYLIVVAVLYCLISKIPSNNIPFGNKYVFIFFVVIVLILTDQTDNSINLTRETFVDTNVSNNTTDNTTNIPVPPTNVQNDKKEEIQNKIISVVTNTVPKIQTEQTEQNTTLMDSINKENKENIENIENKENTGGNGAENDMGNSHLMTKNDIINKTVNENKANSCNCEDIANKAISKFLSNRRLIDNKGMLHYADAYLGDMGYSDLRYENYIPLGAQGDGVYNSWDMGQYQILNTSRWRPIVQNEGRCRKENIPDPQPYDKGQMSLMNWDYSRKVLGPNNINTKFINERLNAQ
jgi:hypothetical protein